MPSFSRSCGRRVDANDSLGRQHILHPYVSRYHVAIRKVEKSKVHLEVTHRNGAAIKDGSQWRFLSAGARAVLYDGDAIALHVTRPLRAVPIVEPCHALTFCADPDSDETVEEE